MDHIRQGKYFRSFVNPPPPPTDGQIVSFSDGLEDCIAEKIFRIKEHFDAINDCRLQSQKIVDEAVRAGKLDAIGEYFYRLLYACEAAEAVILQKWMKYWLKIYRRLSPNQFEADHLLLDVAKAKEVPIAEVYGRELKENGNRLLGLCPFHDERTPSFTIYVDSNSYYCYGCNAGGDVITFLMDKENIGFVEAVRRLIQ
jgi:hypothetical protein